MLDVKTLVWSKPTFDIRKANVIPNLAFHTATATGTMMIVAFGKFTPSMIAFFFYIFSNLII